ncbi:hypothetical protein ACX9NE_14010 [Mycobacterium sp. ML4]
MCPSTESTEAEHNFASDVLRNLLRDIETENQQGGNPFLVSYAWTEGPFIYLVYKAPPSGITWGLARDTRESNIEPGPWPSLDVAVRYYYLLDLDENRMSESFRHPANPDTILWLGDPIEGLPQLPSDIPDNRRYAPQAAPVQPERDHDQQVVNEVRRYADP